MYSTKEYIQLAFENHCFYARTLKEETIFIENILTSVYLKEAQALGKVNS